VQVGGRDLRAVLYVTTDSSGNLEVRLDDLDDGIAGLIGGNVAFGGSRFTFEILSVAGVYSGSISADRNSINGNWTKDGFTRPLVFTRHMSGRLPTMAPTPTPEAAMPPIAVKHLTATLDRELAPVLERGLLSPRSGGGLVVGVLDHGQRLVVAYGTAKPDSIFEIGSITKTFTGLLLAQMAVQKKVRLDEPLRALLPADWLPPAKGPEITLLDLATQHSGLPLNPSNLEPAPKGYSDYTVSQLRKFIRRRGLAKPANAEFHYSNIGFALLGYSLSLRAGVPYGQLVVSEVTGPLHMNDTVIDLSPEQRKRLIQGFNATFDPVDPRGLGLFAGAGALKSTAADLLTYMEASLHPEKYACGAVPGSPAATLPAAIALDHVLRADMWGDLKIALAWWCNWLIRSSYSHGGATIGYTAQVVFDPPNDRAIVVLYNRRDSNTVLPFDERVVENLNELMEGKPSISLDVLSEDERLALDPHTFSDRSIKGSYDCRLAAIPLAASARDPFNIAAIGEVHLVADGKGSLTEGAMTYRLAPPQDLACKVKLESGSYSIGADGTGTETETWKLNAEESPRACFQFFSPARPPVALDARIKTAATDGQSFYSTAIAPFAMLNKVCQRGGTR
jgi:CubicO group peptidase (beta-lactamase class C family)